MSPYFLLSILLGGVYGALFYMWQGKTLADMAYYVLASIVGFGLGQVAFQLLGWGLVIIGPLHLIEASLSAIVALGVARWLRL